jgi:hypothetical protein
MKAFSRSYGLHPAIEHLFLIIIVIRESLHKNFSYSYKYSKGTLSKSPFGRGQVNTILRSLASQ